MVKGISKQVILVRSPDKKLFEQAIFILRDDAPEVTDEELLKEAKSVLRAGDGRSRGKGIPALWTAVGMAATGILWLLSAVL